MLWQSKLTRWESKFPHYVALACTDFLIYFPSSKCALGKYIQGSFLICRGFKNRSQSVYYSNGWIMWSYWWVRYTLASDDRPHCFSRLVFPLLSMCRPPSGPTTPTTSYGIIVLPLHSLCSCLWEQVVPPVKAPLFRFTAILLPPTDLASLLLIRTNCKS